MRVLFFSSRLKKWGGALTLADVGLTLGCARADFFSLPPKKWEGGPVLNLRARDVATTLADIGGLVFLGGLLFNYQLLKLQVNFHFSSNCLNDLTGQGQIQEFLNGEGEEVVQHNTFQPYQIGWQV